MAQDSEEVIRWISQNPQRPCNVEKHHPSRMSGRFSIVVVEDATQNSPSADWSLASGLEGNWGLVWNALMRSCRVVVMGVFGNDFPEVALVQNQQVIQTLLTNRTDPSLSNCIGFWSTKGRPDDFETLRNKDGVESHREF